MRLRYQLVVAVMIITLVITSFLAGRQFQSMAALLPGGGGDAARLVAAALSAGGEGKPGGKADEVSLRPLETFQEVLSHMRQQYVSPIKNERDLTYGAVRGMLAVLRDDPYKDRYSRLLDPEEYRSFLEENEGHFGGIGAEIGVREVKPAAPLLNLKGSALVCPVCEADITSPKLYRIVIIAPLPDSPAERAGLQAGDHIIRVDGVSSAALGLGDTVRRIKGPPGTAVDLMIGREGLPKPLQVKVTRSVIKVRSVEYKVLPEGIGYLRLITFNDTTAGLIKKALKEMRAAGIRGLLLDLRNDAGGGLDVSVQVAGQFIGEGPVVYIQERGGPRQPRASSADARRIDLPLVVLINNGTASAAEILAGAIQDNDLGTLVGTTTFGKGLVQTVFPLHDGSALALTTARYLTPKLRDIDHKGISPDVQVEQPKGLEYIISPLSEKDAQGAAALNLLRQKMQGPVRAAA